MHCNGKCQVRKQIQQDGKSSQENPEHRGTAKNTAFLFTATTIQTHNFSRAATYNYTYLRYAAGIVAGHYNAIFHPPQA